MLLAIDSSSKGYSVAVSKDKNIVFELASAGIKSQNLIPDLKQAFEKHSLKLDQVKVLIVNIGPGSFTGIRTALTFAKTLEANLELKTYPVNNFEILRFLYPDTQSLAFRASEKNDKEFLAYVLTFSII